MKYLVFVFYLCFSFTVSAQIQIDADQAFRISSETKKPVLLIFSGSDWCAPCMRFERKILSESSFQDFVKENIILLQADFPQRKRLSHALEQQNEQLAEQFNPKGIFPRFLVLSADRKILSTLSYANQSPFEFISEIKKIILK